MKKSDRAGAIARRDMAVSMAMRRKEEYLGARVPKELRDRVMQRAKEMGIPVSILMRNILEEAFKEEDNSRINKVGGAVGLTVSSSLRKFDSVLGWERIVLNRSVSCTNCGVQLLTGMDVTLGLGSAQPVILCDACKGGI